MFNGFQLREIAGNKAYVQNEMAYYGVKVCFEKLDEGEVFDKAKPDYWDSDLVISSDALTLEPITRCYRVNSSSFTAIDGELLVLDGKITLKDIPDAAWGSGDTYYILGQGIVRSAGVIRAEIVSEKHTVAEGLEIYDGQELQYKVTFADNRYDVLTPGFRIGFTVDPAHEVIAITAAAEGKEYELIGYNTRGATTAEIIPKSLGGRDITKDPSDAAVFAAYERCMAFFGFDYNAKGKLLDKHFEAKSSGLYLKDEANIQYYTGSIVIPIPGVEVPKTGDPETALGIVMLSVSVVFAAIFVIYRKLRI
jgi:hypothetical protein